MWGNRQQQPSNNPERIKFQITHMKCGEKVTPHHNNHEVE